jgi:mRNA-degrading endonuclease RelE of RelBE toxin-antitoxin system
MYEVFISHEAEKYYKKQDKDTKQRLNKCIDDLRSEPLSGPHIKRLHGELEGKYRYEVEAKMSLRDTSFIRQSVVRNCG